MRLPEWAKIALVWFVGIFEFLQSNSASVMFWLGAVYAVLNIVALVRREFWRGRKNATE